MATRLWQAKWDEEITCRQTRHFFPTGPRPAFSKDFINLPRIICGQMIQIITGHTYMKRHQAIIDESERQRIIAITGGNADSNGDAIIDAPDPTCSLCNDGEETPLHFLSECDKLATLRKDIFGREDLVARGGIPDFSDIPLYKLVSFFKDAKLENYKMRPYLEEYYPTNLSTDGSNRSRDARQQAAQKLGDKDLARYLYRM